MKSIKLIPVIFFFFLSLLVNPIAFSQEYTKASVTKELTELIQEMQKISVPTSEECNYLSNEPLINGKGYIMVNLQCRATKNTTFNKRYHGSLKDIVRVYENKGDIGLAFDHGKVNYQWSLEGTQTLTQKRDFSFMPLANIRHKEKALEYVARLEKLIGEAKKVY